MPQLPPTIVSDELFNRFEAWRAIQIPIPSKTNAIRRLLRIALKMEEEKA
ncbi:MAG: hypothetical protein OEZ48_01475 [Candidatus Bathyarchaeota archaeon]|nr:hypothetical protein [Candidatus Bathyarchaeota archaeon]